jgi:predicted house-cleaning noncanonical NTP pyrophosphatase (MazG superfamily)
MVEVSKRSYKDKVRCLIALDEIHVTFDSAEWKSFPAEILAMLSFNRKYGLQFLCSSQIYERIPKKVRDIANFTVICKNILRADRLFRCYYFEKSDYEAKFEGKKKRAKFIKEFIADDNFYALYDTLEQVDIMIESAKKEKDLKQKAFELLFDSPNEEDMSSEN